MLVTVTANIITLTKKNKFDIVENFAGGRREMYTNLKGRAQLGNQGVEGRIILKYVPP
jgi:hypothetical protein